MTGIEYRLPRLNRLPTVIEARTQNFAQEGATCSRRGTHLTRGTLSDQALDYQGARGPGNRRSLDDSAGTHWVIRGSDAGAMFRLGGGGKLN